MKDNTNELQLLKFNIKTLKVLNLWPDSHKDRSKLYYFLKDYAYLILIQPALVPVIADFILQIIEGNLNDVTDIIENIIAIIDIIGMMYMCVCFLEKRQQIHKIVRELHKFNEYGKRDFVLETENKAIFLTKGFLIYGCLGMGNVAYALAPIMQIDSCELKMHQLLIANKSINGFHCGIITRCRYPSFIDISRSPYFEMIALLQAVVCLLVTTTVLMITMFICSILMHVVKEMENLKAFLREVLNGSNPNVNDQIIYYIKYHIRIIEFSKLVGNSFSKTMVVHLTLTSGVISALGFQILMVEEFGDKLRFGAHLFGWIVLLLLICTFGQSLINESLSIADCLYDTNWYECSVHIRKDILMMLMRSQKPLKLPAASLGSMSLEAFLKILSTAYSYFTLLLKMKTSNEI